MNRRLKELEQLEGAFLKATGGVIQHCKGHDPRVMAHVHADYTEDETHASLVHDCKPGESCARRVDSTARAPRASTGEARAHREDLNTRDLEESEKPRRTRNRGRRSWKNATGAR